MIAHIVAMANNGVIGKDNDIPWKIEGEQKRFKDLTMGKTIIMGRKTYESIDRVLEGRRIIVVSRTLKPSNEAYTLAASVEEAMNLCDQDEILIVGGGSIYAETMAVVDKIYMTVLDRAVEGDVVYPSLKGHAFKVTYKEKIDHPVMAYTYMTYQRI